MLLGMACEPIEDPWLFRTHCFCVPGWHAGFGFGYDVQKAVVDPEQHDASLQR